MNQPPTRTKLSWVTVAAATVTLALTGALSALAYVINQHNEHRLLDLQVKQTATVLQVLIPTAQTPLASAAEIAATNGGSATSFRTYISSYVGAPPKTFVSAGLWQVQGSALRQVAIVGGPLTATPAQLNSTLQAAAKKGVTVPVGPLGVSTPTPRLGWAYAASGYVVYAESPLPPGRHTAPLAQGTPFSNLRFALYLGTTISDRTLLEADEKTPVPGYTAKETVPFGAGNLTLVAGTNRQLGGGLLAALWWIVVIVGVFIAALVTVTSEWLVRRRRQAEGAQAETESQLVEERDISRTLQQALLPDALPTPAGLRADARYVAGGEGVDVGGDWYDLIQLDDRHVFFVIGDVSGRGVRAATTMGMLRFAVRAFASEGHSPSTVLDRLSAMIDVTRGGQFATMLCGIVDVEGHEIDFANAGHLPPLVIENGSSRYLDIPVGPPIGAATRPSYETVTCPVPHRATVLAFTDGLVERHGEALDDSLEQLRSGIDSSASLGTTLDRLIPAAIRTTDDVAILGVQWLQ